MEVLLLVLSAISVGFANNERSSVSLSTCEKGFFETFLPCDTTYNSLDVTKSNDETQTATFSHALASCIVHAVKDYVQCDHDGVVGLDTLTRTIKLEALQRSFKTTALQRAGFYQPVQVDETASTSEQRRTLATNEERLRAARNTAREAVLRKAEATILAILMAYRKAMSVQRASKVRLAIQADAESDDQLAAVLEQHEPATLRSSELNAERTLPNSQLPSKPTWSAMLTIQVALVVVVVSSVLGTLTMGWNTTRLEKVAGWFQRQKNPLWRMYPSVQSSAAIVTTLDKTTMTTAAQEGLAARETELEALCKQLQAKVVKLESNLVGQRKAVEDSQRHASKLQATLEDRIQLVSHLEERLVERKRQLQERGQDVTRLEKTLAQYRDEGRRLESELEAQRTLCQQEHVAQLAMADLLERRTGPIEVAELQQRQSRLRESLAETEDWLFQALVTQRVDAATKTAHVKARERRLCKVCVEEDVNVVLRPCHHLVVCQACSDDLQCQDQPCPICRSVIDGHDRVYFS
eukprot:m.111109 g.111109  ORF g.111109 m.111109 type:complete len:523 (+) comp15375_c0_seq3:112-1680(+)